MTRPYLDLTPGFKRFGDPDAPEAFDPRVSPGQSLAAFAAGLMPFVLGLVLWVAL